VKIEEHPVNDGVLRLAVTGEIDLATADDLYEAITTSASSPDTTEIVVDLADVTFCDSTGIGALVRARAAANTLDVTVTVSNPRGVVRLSLGVTGVLPVLTDPPA
jgi:anti-sigma B factor antagonist